MRDLHRSKVLERLGLKSYINAQNWSTSIGGTYLEPEVMEAMADVAQSFVSMRALLDKACQRVAELCHVDAAYITAGCAAGITLSTAACIAGEDPRKWKVLPFSDDPPVNGRSKILMQAGQITYPEQYAGGGGRLVPVGDAYGCTAAELEEAITERTAGIAAGYHYNVVPRGWVSWNALTQVAKKHDLPCFCDAAGALPPYANLHRLSEYGFDLVIFSGGKGLRGPQNTGLILAKGERGKRLLNAIQEQSAPNMGMGRAYKVSKECIAGLVAALELVTRRDEQQEYDRQLAKAEYMAKELQGIPGVSVSIVPNDGETYEHPLMARVPNVRIDLDKKALELDTANSVYTAMQDGEPGVFIRFPRFEDREFGPFTSRASVFLFTFFLRDGEEELVAHRMRDVLMKKPWSK
jgi:L-seryl-tRNA(Ser) seleniumtransferase